VPGYIFPISGSSVAFLIYPNPLPPVRALIQAGESHPLPPSPYGEGGRGKGLGVRTRYAFTDRRERKKRIPIQDTSQPSMDPESYLARFFLIHSHGRTFSWSHLSKITPSKKNWVENHPWNSLFREFYPAFACPRPKSLPSRLPSRSGGPGAGCKYPAACPHGVNMFPSNSGTCSITKWAACRALVHFGQQCGKPIFPLFRQPQREIGLPTL
jgi:hypothetical protein